MKSDLPPFDCEAADREQRRISLLLEKGQKPSIPCPDCADAPELTIAEDHPAVAGALLACDLCGAERRISAARALAVIERVCAVSAERRRRVRELRRKLHELESAGSGRGGA